MSNKQQTLASTITLQGVGLHSGKHSTLTLKPAPENTGIVFIRTDLDGQPQIKADADLVTALDRSTTLTQNDASIGTIEHCMAALFGMDIHNAFIEVDDIEVPILDGSSKPFVEAIERAGITTQEAEVSFYTLKEPVVYTDPERGVEIMAIPADDYRLTVMVDYNSRVLGEQYASLDNLADFKTDIAACRTFVFLHELRQLIENNLVKGGDLSNALVIVDRELEEEDKGYLHKAFPGLEHLEASREGYLNNVEAHYHNEPARHKLLDVIGDLALVGRRVKAHIIAKRPGHAANVAFAKQLKAIIKNDKAVTIPTYNPNDTPVYDINKITATLPHRPPFLLVDRITEISENHVVGIKNVTMNEPFFEGHFPGNPVMPGVLQIEAMAQTGGILALSTVPDPENYSTYFLKIDEVKFKAKVVPGDTLIFKLTLTEPIRRGIVKMQGHAYVGTKLVSEAILMAQIIKEKNL